MQINTIEEFRANIKPGDSYWPTYTSGGAPGGVGGRHVMLEYVDGGSDGVVRVLVNSILHHGEHESIDYLADLMNHITKRVFTSHEEAIAYNAEMEKTFANSPMWQEEVRREREEWDCFEDIFEDDYECED